MKSRLIDLPNDPLLKMAEVIAKRHSVSPSSVKSAGKFAEDMATLPSEERAEILTGFALVMARGECWGSSISRGVGGEEVQSSRGEDKWGRPAPHQLPPTQGDLHSRIFLSAGFTIGIFPVAKMITGN
jgi:hypothetical protein